MLVPVIRGRHRCRAARLEGLHDPSFPFMPPGREPVQLCPPRSFFRFGVRSQQGEALLLLGLELGECRRKGLEDVRLERVRVDELPSGCVSVSTRNATCVDRETGTHVCLDVVRQGMNVGRELHLGAALRVG